ncbi:MAG: hypothetical protein JRG80_11130 [Deltaproteobacteria bacterium]|nr:hypothetical protein [Deltaproteobacteria bacterium]MBW2399813.1 hypothetical protein [Deltaproteobacteria bacterium]MBW2665392.1 hypothetical protein [Deltaproteobacteria bacterium]
MEKLVYVLWKRPEQDVAELRDELLGVRAKELADLGARRLALSLADEYVAYAQGSIISRLKTPMAATLSFWLDTHLDRGPLEAVLRDISERMAGYLVSESVPIVNTTQRANPGERTPGINTIGFLEKPDSLSYDEWLELWQGQHTRVGIETQSTFLYIQNAVIRPLTVDAPPWVAIVEEGFPADAPTDQKVFYAAGNSDAKLNANRSRMIESCRRFIEFDRLESHVFSQYVLED